MGQITPTGILAITASLLFLLIAARQRFNTPPTNRSGTTFILFHLGMLLYFTVLVAVWFCMTTLLASGQLLGIKLLPQESVANLPALGTFLPVIAAFLVAIGSYSNYNVLRELDEGARQFCVRVASIPLLAEQLAYELANQANFCVVSKELKSKIADVISNNIGPNAVNFNNDRSPSSRFTRAISLYWLFIEPYNNGTPLEFPVNTSSKLGYVKTMQMGEKTVSQAMSHYETLMDLSAAYFSSKRPTRQMEDSLRKIAREISGFVCSLIARFVLLQEKTLVQRRNRLLSMGFDRYDQLPVLGIFQWAAVLFGIGVITLALVHITPRVVPLSPQEAALRVIAFAICMGVSLAAGTFVAQRFIGGAAATRAFRLIFELTIACLIVATISAAVRIGASLVFAALFETSEDFGQIFQKSVDILPAFLMYPVVNTISIAIFCGYLTELNLSRWALASMGAICNGVAFVAVGLMAGMLVPRPVLSELGDARTAVLWIMGTSGVIGAVIGAMVLAMFRKSKRSVQSDAYPDTLETNRAWQPLSTRGEYADNTLGGYLRANVEELEGTYVCFRPMFAKPDIINAYLVKVGWDATQSCLIFEEEKRADSAYLQRGKIYIPEGKPFMNLISVETGSVRLITVSRPDVEGIARGLIMTLSVPTGVHFIPAAAPIVLRRLGPEVPKLGFVHSGEPDYDLYQAQLLQVTPTYGVFGQPGRRPRRPTTAAEKSE